MNEWTLSSLVFSKQYLMKPSQQPYEVVSQMHLLRLRHQESFCDDINIVICILGTFVCLLFSLSLTCIGIYSTWTEYRCGANKDKWPGGPHTLGLTGQYLLRKAQRLEQKQVIRFPSSTVILQVQKSDSGRVMSNLDYVTAKWDVGEETASSGVNDIKGHWHPSPLAIPNWLLQTPGHCWFPWSLTGSSALFQEASLWSISLVYTNP